MSLWDWYVIGWLNQRAGGGDWDSATKRRVTAVTLVVLAVGAIAWAAWKVYVTLQSFTEANTQTVLLGLGVAGVMLVGMIRLLIGYRRLNVDECVTAITFGVGGAVLAIGFKFSALAVDATFGSDSPLILFFGLLLTVLFLAAIAGMVLNAGYVSLLGRSTVVGTLVGTPAMWASLTWLWFLAFGEVEYLPFSTPLPGLNAMDIVFVLPSVLLIISGAGWLAFGRAGVVKLPEESADADRNSDDGEVASERSPEPDTQSSAADSVAATERN